ncbi:bisdemethoxycurcumin synthase-like [Triticum dicoccoides]|uniref:bisdemethoxycurcumin synthase-like n=1 Tax=Triticum dicoccoides TaxID=85692 RepID=UPI001890D01D|nr:bisdemethoxycurcumin synthase-like [Triticum dicoccoides]
MGSCGSNGHGTAVVVVPRPHAEGPAAMLGIGTANPTGVLMPQDVFADTLFRITNSDHLTELKHKLTRICGNTGIDKRHFHLTEETLAAHPELLDPELPSLGTRVDMTVDAVPKLAQRAAAKAIAEWGRPPADITHLVFTTYSACGAPSADLRLATLLGLRPTVSRTILSLHGCYGGGRALGLAKELAENNRGARVLVACSETTLVCFGAPDGGNLVGHAIFGDGAGAVIVGAGPFLDGEQRPIFEMVHAMQTTVPKTEHALGMQVTGGGIDFHLSIQVPTLIGQNVERCLLDAFRGGDDDDDDDAHLPSPLSGNGNKWNDLFWAVHPGGRQILDNIDKVLKLEPEKLAASRHVLREYGNMSGATIVFVLDELRQRRSLLPEWGAMMAFGPGITIETMVLRCPR